MILDDSSGFLYIADTGNQRILKFNVNSGNYSYDLTPYGESLAEYFMMENADWEIYIEQNLEKPSGIDIYNDRLVVSDYASGNIIFYDISVSPPIELGRIDTGIQNNIMGIKIDSNQKIWYVNYQDNNVIRIDFSLIGDISVTVEAGDLLYYPSDWWHGAVGPRRAGEAAADSAARALARAAAHREHSKVLTSGQRRSPRRRSQDVAKVISGLAHLGATS